jgi:hypothetical protein
MEGVINNSDWSFIAKLDEVYSVMLTFDSTYDNIKMKVAHNGQ